MHTDARGSILVIGYGNPGRQDDGLGPACAEALARLDLPGVTVDLDYQLTVEDAAQVAAHAVVVFIDADATGTTPYAFRRVTAGGAFSFSTHSVEAEQVMALAVELFGARTDGYILGIRGHVFGAREGFERRLSPAAQKNLDAALQFITDTIRERSFAAHAQPAAA